MKTIWDAVTDLLSQLFGTDARRLRPVVVPVESDRARRRRARRR